jgi:hypothetical protein
MAPALLIRPRRRYEDAPPIDHPVERMPGGQATWYLACGQGG